MKSASSVLAKGSISQTGKTIALDATLFNNGDISGTIGESGSTVDIVKIGSTDYLKSTSAFYETTGAPASVAALLAGKWVEIPDSTVGLGNSVSLHSLSNSLTNSHGALSAGTTTTVNGQAVVSVHDSKGGTLYVATTGKPYPVEITGSGATGTGAVSFTNWDKGSTPAPPAGARSISSFG